MFEPVVRESASGACASRIRAAILRGELAPGARIPAERELAALFGVNRGTLRAALRELELAGLLSVQHGSGYSVRDFRVSGGPALVPALADLARESGDLATVAADLLLVRRALAGALVERLASHRLGRPALRAIDEALAAFATVASRSPPASPAALAAADLGVVRALVAATESPVLGLFVNPIASILERVPELRDAVYADPAANVAAYRAVVDALRAGEVPAALITRALEARDQATLARLRGRSSPQPPPRRSK